MAPDELSNEERLRESSHPSRDTGQQPEELYDMGLELSEPNAGNAVTGYDASKDQRLERADQTGF